MWVLHTPWLLGSLRGLKLHYFPVLLSSSCCLLSPGKWYIVEIIVIVIMKLGTLGTLGRVESHGMIRYEEN